MPHSKENSSSTELVKEKTRAQNLAKLERMQISGLKVDEEEKNELEIEREEESLPIQVRERRQTVQVYQVFREKARWGEFYRVFGMVFMLLGGYFLSVPFYNVVCQTFGFTLKQYHTDYRFADDEISVFRKYKISFHANAEDEIPFEFQPEKNSLVVNAGETALSFYKVLNRSDKPVAGIAIYQIFPEDTAIYFNKI